MHRTDRSRRRFAGLVAVAFVLGIAGVPQIADAQTEGQADVGQFGGYIASARGNAIQITYDSPNLLATGSPVVQFSVPEALATLNSGPVGYSLASFLFPGPLIADLDAALAASGTSTGIPPYPVRSEAFFPSGPTSTSQGEQGTEMVATTEFADSQARASYAGLSLDPVASIGGITAASQTLIEGDQLVSRARSDVSRISIAGGLISIDGVTSDLVATSNGAEAASSGGTSVTGLEILGLPATVDADGVRFVERPDRPDDPANPVRDALDPLLGGVTGPVGDALDETLAGPLNDLLDQVGGAGDQALQQLFEASGIEIKLLDPVATSEGGLATRSASGLSVTLNYDGQNTPVLTDVLALLPTADLPSENLGPIPFSPQALVKLLEKVHTMSFVIGVADVSASATEAFVFEDPTFTPTTPTPSPVSGGTSPGSTTSGGFESATPALPPPSAPQTVAPVPVSNAATFPFGDAIPALLIFAAVLGTPFFAAGSTRLADNALAPVLASCPDGLDQPPLQEAGS
ncbi:choice-of-anchor P family protein [Actinospongicola halichondriae]|uniref:choice-of-anchor P family protein n=1 Tax=Actinospongicola halichondriae TaxID=3236844 RepID=UPI003D50941C